MSWNRRDRDALVRMAEKLGRPWGTAHNGGREYSVYVVRERSSTHLTFHEDGRVVRTEIIGRGAGEKTMIDWLDGTLREWCGELGIGVDELLAVLP